MNEDCGRDACGVGLVAAGKAGPSHQIIQNGLEILRRLAHRGACGADGITGDGAGLLMQIPDAFFRKIPALKDLPPLNRYAVGCLFLSQKATSRHEQKIRFAMLAQELGLRLIAWREVPVEASVLGPQALSLQPKIEQVFVAPANEPADFKRSPRHFPQRFPRQLFLLRRRAEAELRRETKPGEAKFYIASLSHHTLVYKGLLKPEDLGQFFPDLRQTDLQSRFAMVHSRFSTNTLPAWELAHPFRYLSHNGEINTLRGNLNWLTAREEEITSALCPEIPASLRPLVPAGQSDSQSLDDLIDLLTQGGRSLPHALMMALPEAWEANVELLPLLKSFYSFHALRLEPWDGPAAVCFADGEWLGAILDRNGLRPCRYQILDDGMLILASETGVLDVPADRVVKYGRLGPGEMLAIDFKSGNILGNDELKLQIAGAWPYGKWVQQEQRALPQVEDRPPSLAAARLSELLLRFGYTYEELQSVLLPMFSEGEEVSSSMGNDTPLAVLSDQPQPLFKYFRQMFAQVTNPPMDPIREQLIMSLTTYLGPRAKLFSQNGDGLVRYRLTQPILNRADRASVQTLGVVELEILFSADEDLARRLEELCQSAATALQGGPCILILSDRNASAKAVPIPSLLAVSTIHHHLSREGLRARASLVVETGDARDVHHFACLLGFGADAVHPYLAAPLAERFLSEGVLTSGLNAEAAEARFIQAINKGLLKILSKMGIATLHSYRGAQVFEILGLDAEVARKYFPLTPSRIGGLDIQAIAREALLRHGQHGQGNISATALPVGGEIHYRRQGETHLWSPQAITQLQRAVREKDAQSYAAFSAEIEKSSRFTLRGLFEFSALGPSLALAEVEPAADILRRFTTGAMSLGALGREAHESLAVAMNRIGAKSNSGEGGEDPGRSATNAAGDSKNSAIKQIASARFGVTIDYLANAQELQIKMAQGAKPGEGGQLPGHKVDPYIARLRHSTPGVTLISPPPHHDIYSIEDLAQLIFDLKSSNPNARVSVKLVAESGVGTVAAGVAKAMADKIIISGDCGGTGASPLSSIKYAGIPWELGLAEAQRVLVANGLRGRVTLEADGGLKTGRDVAFAALLGAEEFGFSTAPLITQGCLMMRKCHLNTCPVGIATQDPFLRAKFTGLPEHVIEYFYFVAEELRSLMANLGFRSMSEMIGRNDLLIYTPSLEPTKARGLDLSELVHPAQSKIPGVPSERQFSPQSMPTNRNRETTLDQALLTLCEPAIYRGERVKLQRTIQSTDRAVGTRLSHYVARAHGLAGLSEDALHIDLTGVAGQSFGAFLARGITLSLEGMANDYVGKGLSGGSIRVFPPSGARTGEKPLLLVGNTCLYGATSGEIFIAGAAGERFAVRNSGALAVVEGLGDHGCEYMTGGRVIVLGETGRNFAAGMSGGLAFVYDEVGRFAARCNPTSVEVGTVFDPDDEDFLIAKVRAHFMATRSRRAREILRHWEASLCHFVRVRPLEYGRPKRHSRPPSKARHEGILHG